MASMQPDERETSARREEIVTQSSVGGTDVGPPSRGSRALRTVAGGSITQAVCGVGAAVLAILGLAGLLPVYMVAVATIALGVAFLAEGGSLAARWEDLAHEFPGTRQHAELGGGLGAEFVAGVAGVALGILALIGLYPRILIPVAIIVFGGGLLLGSAATMDLGNVFSEDVRGGNLVRSAAKAASGTQVLVGLAAIVLGILALIGVDPLTVSLVATLAVGAAFLLSGSAAGTRVRKLLHR